MNKRITTKIDMHLHTRGSDGSGTPDEIARNAVEHGLDGLCITDHHNTCTKEGNEVAEACREAGLLVFRGAEISTAQGHALLYGVTAEYLNLGWYPDIQKLVNEARYVGGVVIPSHPYHGVKKRLGDKVLRLCGVPALEICNGQRACWGPSDNGKASVAAKQMGIAGIGGSDAHSAYLVGACYTEFQGHIETEQELIHSLLSGSYMAVINNEVIDSYTSLPVINVRDLDTTRDCMQVSGYGTAEATIPNWSKKRDPFFFSEGWETDQDASVDEEYYSDTEADPYTDPYPGERSKSNKSK